MDGHVITEVKRSASLPPLSSGIYLRLPLQSIAEQTQDLSKVFVMTDMTVAGQQVSRNLLYLEPTKMVQLIPAKLSTKLSKLGDNYSLTITSPVLARDVYATFGDLDVKLSDNYLDIVPGETVQITVRSSAPASELMREMQVVSLTDAFASQSQSVPSARKEMLDR
jgi:beta-mannosidase